MARRSALISSWSFSTAKNRPAGMMVLPESFSPSAVGDGRDQECSTANEPSPPKIRYQRSNVRPNGPDLRSRKSFLAVIGHSFSNDKNNQIVRVPASTLELLF